MATLSKYDLEGDKVKSVVWLSGHYSISRFAALAHTTASGYEFLLSDLFSLLWDSVYSGIDKYQKCRTIDPVETSLNVYSVNKKPVFT